MKIRVIQHLWSITLIWLVVATCLQSWFAVILKVISKIDSQQQTFYKDLAIGIRVSVIEFLLGICLINLTTTTSSTNIQMVLINLSALEMAETEVFIIS